MDRKGYASPQMNEKGNNGQYEMRPLLNPDLNLTDFLEEVSRIKESIEEINRSVNEVKRLQNKMLQATDASGSAEIRRQVENYTQQTQYSITKIKGDLKNIEPRSGQSDIAPRKNAFSAVTKSFIKAIENQRQAAEELQGSEERQIERQVKIVNPNATYEEINEAKQGGQSVFAGSRGKYAQDALASTKDRHQDIVRLAQSVQELSVLFQQMQDMLEQQAGVLDTIEQSAEGATQDMEKGLQHVEKAKISALSTRRNKWICFGIFLVILIIIIVVLVIEIPKNKSS